GLRGLRSQWGRHAAGARSVRPRRVALRRQETGRLRLAAGDTALVHLEPREWRMALGTHLGVLVVPSAASIRRLTTRAESNSDDDCRNERDNENYLRAGSRPLPLRRRHGRTPFHGAVDPAPWRSLPEMALLFAVPSFASNRIIRWA